MNKYSFVSFTSTKKDGNMNTNAKFFPSELTAVERKLKMQENKQKLAEKLGIDSYKKIFIPIQKNMNNPDLYEDGHTLVLTKDMVNQYEDLYDFDYNCDIVKITSETPKIAIGYPMADCAIITAVNLKTNEAVMAHCGGEYINRYLPMQLIDKLGGKEEDIKIHVSPFAHVLTYKTGKPKWISNEQIWKQFITSEIDGLKINQLEALKKMLLERKIKYNNIYFYPYNTIANDNFYSHSNACNGILKDEGRQLAGVVLTDNFKETGYAKVFK